MDEDIRSGAAAEGPKPFTVKQGQYLAFIYYYTEIHGTPPGEADLQRFFRVTPPVVHQMIKTLHTRGFIDREPGKGALDQASAHADAVAGPGVASGHGGRQRPAD